MLKSASEFYGKLGALLGKESVVVPHVHEPHCAGLTEQRVADGDDPYALAILEVLHF